MRESKHEATIPLKYSVLILLLPSHPNWLKGSHQVQHVLGRSRMNEFGNIFLTAMDCILTTNNLHFCRYAKYSYFSECH